VGLKLYLFLCFKNVFLKEEKRSIHDASVRMKAEEQILVAELEIFVPLRHDHSILDILAMAAMS